jgi:hypothetical protein
MVDLTRRLPATENRRRPVKKGHTQYLEDQFQNPIYYFGN